MIRVLNKILQAYRIRLKCLEKRKEIVEGITRSQHNQYGVRVDQSEIEELRRLIKHESKLLKIIEVNEYAESTLLNKATDYLAESLKSLQSNDALELEKELEKYNLNLTILIELCQTTLTMLDKIRRSLVLIRNRLKSEEELILKVQLYQDDIRYSDEITRAFKIFAYDFTRELEVNETLNKELKVFKEKYKIQIDGLGALYLALFGAKAAAGIMVSSLIGGAAGAGIGYLAGDAQTGGQIGFKIGAAISFLAIVINSTLAIDRIYLEEQSKSIKSENLIRDIQQKFGKRHWWSFITG